MKKWRYHQKYRLQQAQPQIEPRSAIDFWASLAIGLNGINSRANELPSGNVFYSPINGINITNNIWDATARDANGNLQAVEPTRINH